MNSKTSNELGHLAVASHCPEPLNLSGFSTEQLLEYYQDMSLIRAAEYAIAKGRQMGVVGGPVHLSTGQEAIAVGLASSLKDSDKVLGAHRSHAHVISLGVNLVDLFAEILGKPDGLSKGMGGSMHLQNLKSGFLGSVPIVAGTIPLAVGAAHAAKLKGESFVAVAFLGDGASEEGIFHESLNLAKVLGVPVIFVVENNLFSSHMHISLRQSSDRVSRFADVHDIRNMLVDGNDVVSVCNAARELVTYARKNSQPVLLEAVTFRWYGHVDWREDIDVGVNRSSADLTNWRKRDPLARIAAAMKNAGMVGEDTLATIRDEIDMQVSEAWERAKGLPAQSDSIHTDWVYS